MDNFKEKAEGSITSSPGSNPLVEYYDPSKESVWTRLGLTFESFKRAPGIVGNQVIAGELSGEDLERVKAEGPRLQAKMKPRHLAMIAVGGSIGTGLFVGTGAVLHDGGPAGVLIAFILIGIMLINVTQALGEMSIVYPVSGGFYILANRFLDPAFAFANGWNYVLQWAVSIPLEITVAATTVQYWTDTVPIAVWITIFWVLIIIVSVFGTLGYAEEEFWSSCLKLLVAIIFVIIGIVCICGGGPSSGQYNHYIGGLYWSDPGPFANGFKGICSVFVTAAFAFSGTELVGLAASETPNPRKTMPGAVKGTFWRITIIYITTLTVIGLLIPYNDERLLGGSGATASPFVIALDNANIHGLNHVVNATICISVLSIGLASVFAASRTMVALAETGYAPKIFTYIDKSSRPLPAVIVLLLLAPIAYVNVVAAGDVVCTLHLRLIWKFSFSSNYLFFSRCTVDWLVAISGLSAIFTWLSICLCHIRFRRAWKVQGHSLEELPFQAAGGVWGSWFGVILIVLVLIAQFYIAIFPLGGLSSPSERASSFFGEYRIWPFCFLCERPWSHPSLVEAYLAAPVVVFMWIIGYVWKGTRPKRAHEIDLDTGRKSWLTVEEMRAYRAERARAPLYIRIFRLLFTN
ncbi:APC amino acid permease [Dendrothele bispora CBS 962.96]|uniref:APC amino acid permease n=1 Tax=Dendrothele bispora (strain CBS 962.96) TaxID=1314807 RepID=A0A4S8KRN2_DENBC|nr:APC amino acid permease [Dendrothele bispora CBS 962.96]